MTPKIAVVVPNLNFAQLKIFLQKNWLHLQADIKDGSSALIIVSSDLDDLKIRKLKNKYHPQIYFLTLTKNRGFAQTVNYGFKYALDQIKSCQWLATVNDDVILPKDWWRPLIKVAHNKTASLNPVICTPSGQIESAGIKILPFGKAEPQTKLPSKTMRTQATNAACVIYRQSALKQVGLFDEHFGSYLEDIDLSLRLSKAGWHHLVLPTVKITHQRGATSSRQPAKKAWLDLKNWWLLILKHPDIFNLVRNFPQILIERGRNFSGLIKAIYSEKNKWLHWFISSLLLIIFFLFLRLYHLKTSLLFFNDIGRDFLILARWQNSLKPPLLGPQTSALPYNQSAIYFYLLMPFFWLSKQSFFSTIYTLVFFYLIIFIWGIYKLKSNKSLFNTLLITSFLITIHPQVIAQNRFVWNPSFVPPLIILAYFSWEKLRSHWSNSSLHLFAAAITLAVSLSYSIAPVFIAFLVVSVWVFRKKLDFIKIGLASIFWLFIWNLPTVFFEIRHKFFLTKLLINGEKLPQRAITFQEKTKDLLHFSLPGLSITSQYIFLAMFVTFLLLSLIFYSKIERQRLLSLLSVFVVALLVTFLVPISIQAHYIFGIICLAMLLIAQLRPVLSGLMLFLLSLFWLKPSQVSSYFQPAFRSVEASSTCAATICSQLSEPIFVSVQSDLHPYHNGMEWKYLLLRNGCEVKELDTEISQARQMVVIVDHSQYTHGSTAYNELTQFGPAREVTRFHCQNNLSAVLLQK